MQIRLNIERTDIKFSVDKESIKEFEDVLTRALHRAIVGAARNIVKEDLLGSVLRTVAQFAQQQPAPAVLARKEASPSEPLHWPPSAHTTEPRQHEAERPAQPSRGERKRAERRSVKNVCRVVTERPHGFIERAEALKLLGGENNSGALSTWILSGEVNALIVRGITPPTKGLPGRLMVEKASLEARDKQRQQSPLYKKPPADRRW